MRVSVRVIPREDLRVWSTRRGIPLDGGANPRDSGAGHATPASGGMIEMGVSVRVISREALHVRSTRRGIPRDGAANPSGSGAGPATPASGGIPDGGAASPSGSEADPVTPTRQTGTARRAESTPLPRLAATHRARRSISRMPEAAARIGVVRRLLVVECSLQIALQTDLLIIN